MKLSHLVLFATLVASLASGSSRRAKNITPLPGYNKVGGVATGLDPATPLDPTAGGGRFTGPNNGGGLNTGGRLNPNGTPPDGRDLSGGASNGTGNGLTPGGEKIAPIPGDHAQADRTKWDTWPQDADTLRGNTIYFDTDKSIVKRSDSAKVAAIAEYLKGHPGYMLKVDGHADERGTEDYNRALGERRALSLREMLLNLGVSQDSVVTSTFGEDRPVELGHSEAAWAKNRRAEPVILISPGSAR